MPAFRYKAITDNGKQVKGIIEADNEKHLRQQLSQRKPHIKTQKFVS